MPRRVGLLIGTVLLIRLGLAADFTGGIAGTITDSTGGLVPQAQISATNLGTGVVRTTSTAGLGEFAIAQLPSGTYTVRVQKDGFRTAVFPNVEVRVDDTARLDAALELGPVKEEVVVSGATPVLDVNTTEVGNVITDSSVLYLPLNERNFLNFALLVPGVQMPADGSQNILTSGSFSVNGAREQSNNFLLDGIDNTDPYNNQYSVLPPVEAIEEFKVQATASSAEFGRTAGAQINIVLKSGANDLHGSALDLVRNRHLDARNFFDRPSCTPASVPGTCADTPGLDRNQFGGSLGGPIRKNHTFFFIAYEGLRLRGASTRQATVPSQLQRAAALNAVPASRQSSAGLAALGLYPAANAGADLSRSNTFVSSPLLHNHEDQGVVRVDHQLTTRDTLTGHYALFREDDFEPFNQKFLFTNLPGFGNTYVLRSQSAGAAWQRSVSPQLTNQVRAGFNRRNNLFLQQGSGTDLARQIGFPTTSADPLNFGYPNIALAGFDGIGTAIVLPQDFIANTFQYSDDAAWNPRWQGGRHQLHFGADLRRVQENFFLNALSRGEWFFLGAFTGSPVQDLVAGLPTVAVTTTGDSHSNLRTTSAGVYLVDTVALRPNFSLSLGLRYEYNQPVVDTRDRLSEPDLSPRSLTCTPSPDCRFLLAGVNGFPRATYEGTKGDFGPRVGFAWRPFGSNALVVRSAYGVFYDAGILNVNIYPHANPPFFNVLSFANRGSADIQSILNPAFSLPQPPSSTMISPNYRDGYLQQWHFSLERQAGKDTVLSARYVGSKGTHLLDQRQGNQPPPGGTPPYPQFGTIRLLAADGSSIYHSLQLSAEKRFAARVGLLAGYTWSRAIDDVSALQGSAGDPGFPQNSSDLRSERGLSDFHAEHRFVMSARYDLPLHPFSGAGAAALAGNRLLGGWRLSAIVTLQTGRPFTVNRGVDQSKTGVTLGYFDRPDLIADPRKPGPVPANPNPSCQKTRSQGGLAADLTGDPASWFNACAFVAPATARFGTAGRNIVIGPGFANTDFALHKDIGFSERHRLELRFESFNLFNHPNFDIPNKNFDSPTFAAVLSENAYHNKPPRQVQLGLRYQF